MSDAFGNVVAPQAEVADTMALRLERMRVREALDARDVAVSRLSDACASVREKTEAMEVLRVENAKLRNSLEKREDNSTDKENDINVPVAPTAIERNATSLAGMEDRFVMLTVSCDVDHRGKFSNGPVADVGVLKDLSNMNFSAGPSTFCSPLSASATPGPDIPESPWTPHDGERQVTLPTVSTAEKIEARYAVLASLPLPSGIPDDTLTPISIPSPYTLHDFIGTTSGQLRLQLGNYRVFQQSTTTWCPEREEHGYFLTPIFKCMTNPRVTTAHKWVCVDLSVNFDRPTECFYNNDGKWYYAGVYKSFRLEDLCPQEWECLSTETSQSLIKETLSARKNTSPQNVYETSQLYSVGALKIACIGLQCIGFNSTLYRGLLEHAALCTQANKWRSPPGGSNSGLGLGSGTIWNAMSSGPGSPGMPAVVSTVSGSGPGVIGRPVPGSGSVQSPTPTLRLLQPGTQEFAMTPPERVSGTF